MLDEKLISALKIGGGGTLPPYHLFEYNRNCLSKAFGNLSFDIVQFGKRLWLPEFLSEENVRKSTSWALKVERGIFLLLKFMIEKLGWLPAARAIVVARKKS
ncbi:MAG: hypothetical protein HY586_03815 [Candidatus Omnitrophica bacterium]|nr:hypothetical protein [Candidatus Omnitrophota bacterium]